MSLVAPSQRRLAWPVAVALLAAAGLSLALYLPNRPQPTTAAPETVAAPGVVQAAWDVNSFPAGGKGVRHLSKKAKERLGKQREPLATLIKNVYDAMFLQPAALKQAIRANFAADAARRALDRHIGLPSGVEKVKLGRRTAKVGIHVQGASRAAASVVISGSAAKKDQKTRFRHRSTLWLERHGGKWKVIAFDVTQGPGK